jgi:hypothetical protein
MSASSSPSKEEEKKIEKNQSNTDNEPNITGTIESIKALMDMKERLEAEIAPLTKQLKDVETNIVVETQLFSERLEEQSKYLRKLKGETLKTEEKYTYRNGNEYAEVAKKNKDYGFKQMENYQQHNKKSSGATADPDHDEYEDEYHSESGREWDCAGFHRYNKDLKKREVIQCTEGPERHPAKQTHSPPGVNGIGGKCRKCFSKDFEYYQERPKPKS